MPEKKNSQILDPEEFEGKSVDEVLKRFNTHENKGLAEDDVKEKRGEFGWNAIEEEEKSWIIKFLAHFWGPIPWMLEIACILAAIAQRWEDFGVIFVMLLINGSVSYWHESKADSAIKALKEKLSPRAKVIRNGEQKEVDARELVPGDIVKLQMGDVVPADIKLLHDQNLSIDESALTGESVPVDKGG
ncbi:MAG: HAD-IC family P-type ATPase, partial [Bacteroidota bacterium]